MVVAIEGKIGVVLKPVAYSSGLGSVCPELTLVFPYCPIGTVFRERTSEAIDVRIIVQVCREVSWRLDAGVAVLGIATDENGRFWAGLFDGGGPPLFEHNRLTGPSSFAARPARSADIDRLCSYFGGAMRRKAVVAALSVPRLFRSANRPHSLAEALGLPDWLPGVGYSRIVAETVPPEAGTPRRPPRFVRELRFVEDPFRGLEELSYQALFQRACRHAFAFLTEKFGFEDLGQLLEVPREEPPPNVYRIGDYTAPNPFVVCYRNRHMIVLIDYVFKEAMTRLFLIGQARQPFGSRIHWQDTATPNLLDIPPALATPQKRCFRCTPRLSWYALMF